jgi:predicted phosphodiesterase
MEKTEKARWPHRPELPSMGPDYMHMPSLQSMHKIKATRRDFLKLASPVLASLSVDPRYCFSQTISIKTRARFGIFTDSHYANSAPRGIRYYKESISKMTECVELMNRQKVDFLIELGDFKDQDTPPNKNNTLLYLHIIESVFKQFKGPRYHVLGNHDLDNISKEEFANRVDNTKIPVNSSFYAFDLRGLHFIVLDANFKSDGTDYGNGNFAWQDTNIPPAEIDWLKRDLKSTDKPAIVFIHQQLDGDGEFCVNNAEEVRAILENSSKTFAVFQGHYHQGHYSQINGIHYYTLKAMVDGSGSHANAYALVEVFDDGAIMITGYRRVKTKVLGPNPAAKIGF